MITKNDCLSILVRMSDSGISGADACVRRLAISKDIPLDVLRFISVNRGLEAGNFYEMLRKSHNKKKSPLYVNILNQEQSDPNESALTLNCLLTQILLYGKKLENKEAFYKAMRAEEITRVLNEYFKDGVYSDCAALLKLIKSDLLVLEYIAGRRELQD